MSDAARTDDADEDAADHDAEDSRPTLDTAVRRRRTDQAFFIRLGRTIAQHEALLDRLR